MMDVGVYDGAVDPNLPPVFHPLLLRATHNQFVHLLESIVPYIDALRQLGFVLLDPESDETVEREGQLERLLAGYAGRQRMVGGVADMIEGTAPGRRK
jgi:hypothetical protein